DSPFVEIDLTGESVARKRKAKGTLTGRPRKPSYMVERAINMYHSNNFTISEITKETGISKSSLYRYLME
ncbi:helix-turn-helix domain-containing protein, partial [Streptomyces sp. NPDC002159]